MAVLELSDEERDVLVKLLEETIAELRYEIGSTDSFDFRQGLKRKEAVLEAIRARVRSD